MNLATEPVSAISEPESQTTALPTMLVNIQFLRFAAAMLVVLYHSSSRIKSTGVEQGLFFDIFEAVGFAGVDIFFVISGFIMAYTTVDSRGFNSGLNFFKRRVARIYSGYWPFYFLAILLFAWTGSNYLADAPLWRSFILWPAPRPVIAVSWTLVYEMYFYILFTLLISFAGSKRKSILIIALLATVAWALHSHFVRHVYDPEFLDLMSYAEAYMTSPYLAEFFCGSLLAGWLSNKQTGASWSWLIAGIVMFLAGGWINNGLFAGNIEQGYYVIWRVLIFGTASLFIVTGLVRLEYKNKTTALRFSLAAGGASYAIYLSHILWIYAARHFGLYKALGQYSSWLVQLITLGFAAFILFYCIAHYRIVERPLHNLFKKWLGI